MRTIYLFLLLFCFFVNIDDAEAGRRRKVLCISQETGVIKFRRKCKENETILDAEAISNLGPMTEETPKGFRTVVRKSSGPFDCRGGLSGGVCGASVCCDSGSTLVGGGAWSDVDLEASYPIAINCWHVRTTALAFTTIEYKVYAMCAS